MAVRPAGLQGWRILLSVRMLGMARELTSGLAEVGPPEGRPVRLYPHTQGTLAGTETGRDGSAGLRAGRVPRDMVIQLTSGPFACPFYERWVK